MSISSFSELKKAIQQALENGMDELGEVVKETVKEHIEKDVYGSYSPKVYSRTYQLSTSLDHKTEVQSGLVGLEIFHDPSGISASGSNQHRSILDGSDVSKSIPSIVHNGLAPNIFKGEGGVWTSSRPYMDNAYNTILRKNLHVTTLEKSLQGYGFKIL